VCVRVRSFLWGVGCDGWLKQAVLAIFPLAIIGGLSFPSLPPSSFIHLIPVEFDGVLCFVFVVCFFVLYCLLFCR
jgi:hypothetical protein